jgi:hypothetical protein
VIFLDNKNKRTKDYEVKDNKYQSDTNSHNYDGGVCGLEIMWRDSMELVAGVIAGHSGWCINDSRLFINRTT